MSRRTKYIVAAIVVLAVGTVIALWFAAQNDGGDGDVSIMDKIPGVRGPASQTRTLVSETDVEILERIRGANAALEASS